MPVELQALTPARWRSRIAGVDVRHDSGRLGGGQGKEDVTGAVQGCRSRRLGTSSGGRVSPPAREGYAAMKQRWQECSRFRRDKRQQPPFEGLSPEAQRSNGGVVGVHDDARVEHLRVGQREHGLLPSLGEEPPPTPEHDRKDHQSVLVDQVVLHQGVHEGPAAGDEEVPRSA